jgi:uncharacterized membrane protein
LDLEALGFLELLAGLLVLLDLESQLDLGLLVVLGRPADLELLRFLVVHRDLGFLVILEGLVPRLVQLFPVVPGFLVFLAGLAVQEDQR